VRKRTLQAIEHVDWSAATDEPFARVLEHWK
jgi:hypothetical protein